MLRQKHQNEMQQLQQRQQLAQSVRVEQQSASSSRKRVFISPVQDHESMKESLVATLAIAREDNHIDQHSILVQF